MTSESSAASLWRFGVNADQVQPRSTSEDGWDVTPELLSAFRQLAEVVCPILSRCKHRCKIARREGCVYGLKQLELALPSRPQISLQALNQLCHRLLQKEQAQKHATVAPLPPTPYPALPELSGLRTSHNGWEDVDTMYLEQEFRLGSFEFTKFYKHRTMEIRLAFVSGVRDVLTDLSCWAAANQANPSHVSQDMLSLVDLRAYMKSLEADLAARPFTPLETVPEEESASLSLARPLVSRRQSTSASSTHDGARQPSPSPIGMASLSHALPQARDIVVADSVDTADNFDSTDFQPRAQRRKYSTSTVAPASLATAPAAVGRVAVRTLHASPVRHPLRNARLFGYAGHKRDERLAMETDMEEIEVPQEGSKRPKPMA
eukprot:m.272684 g.272684  ORF g.272684 m.272684 type:complete len:376 (+) comp17679_c0_seq2:6332-7459(+)